MENSPRAVPLFLKRLNKLALQSQVLEEAKISSSEIGTLLITCPEAARSLLEALTVLPALHDDSLELPSEVNFAPRSVLQLLWNVVNHGSDATDVFTFLVKENEAG